MIPICKLMRGNLDTIFGLNWIWRIEYPMDFLKCRNVRWTGPEKRNKPNVVATTAKHPDSRSQISCYGWMQPTYMHSVGTFWGRFTSRSRINASRRDLLNLPIATATATATAIAIVIVSTTGNHVCQAEHESTGVEHVIVMCLVMLTCVSNVTSLGSSVARAITDVTWVKDCKLRTSISETLFTTESLICRKE